MNESGQPVEVSLIASAIRTELYNDFFNSLRDVTVNIEVVFVGNRSPLFPWKDYDQPFKDLIMKTGNRVSFLYIETANIKPAQCYEIARRAATGDTICWVADDCEFKGDILGEAYRYWKFLNDEKVILSIQTKEYYLTGPKTVGANFCDMSLHSFYGGDPNTPRMAPLGLMSREYLDRLGGIDRRYVCGQYENDIVMRVLADGGTVRSFGDETSYVDIDHIGKMQKIDPSVGFVEFQQRPFAKGYINDREVLETSWTGKPKGEMVSLVRYDKFEPYSNEGILLKSQSNQGIWV